MHDSVRSECISQPCILEESVAYTQTIAGQILYVGTPALVQHDMMDGKQVLRSVIICHSKRRVCLTMYVLYGRRLHPNLALSVHAVTSAADTSFSSWRPKHISEA